jgi:hypothetical protein
MDRWYAEYNQRENTAKLIARAYAVLQIPRQHIQVFSLDLPAGYGKHSRNPFHTVTDQDPRYASQWKAMFGSALEVAPVH